MKTLGSSEELSDTVYERMDSDEDPEEDPEEEYEEEYEEVSEEETGADPEEDLEGEELNAELNEETGFALSKTIHETVVSQEFDAKRKKRRSRWDLEADQVGASGEGDNGSKKRRTRWGSDVPSLKTIEDTQLPESMGDLKGSELFQKLKHKVFSITKEIARLEAHHDNATIAESRRQQKEKLVTKRRNILNEMIKVTSKLQEDDRKRSKFVKKVYVPVKEYPSYNFAGLLIGPRGNTQKKMEVETGATIKLRGKGSTMKDRKFDSSDDEELHVYIEAHSKQSLDAAVAMVEKILIPLDDGSNEFKRAQLEELARLKGTLYTNQPCEVCNEPGHRSILCPNRQSSFEKVIACTKCGSFSHGVSQCPVKTKLIKEINEANLYVGYLPQTFDDNRLKELFCPFGKISQVTVIMDTTSGLSKGYGFVNFESHIDAAIAVEHMNRYQIDGKMLAVRVAGIPPPPPKLPVLNPLSTYPRPMSPWMGPDGLILGPSPLPQPGFLALNPIPPYPRPIAIAPNISGPCSGPTGTFLSTKETLGHAYTPSSSMAMNMPSHFDSSSMAMNMPSHFDPSYLYGKQDSSQFPGDPDYRGSSSLFPGDPEYRGSSSASLFSDFDYSK